MAEVDLKALFATTKERISKKLSPSILDRIPLVQEIRGAGNLKEVVDGGRSFSEPALIDESQAVGAYKGTDVLNVSQQMGIEKFEYSPAFMYGSVFMAGTELAMNAGDQAAVSLLQARLQQMRDSMSNKLDLYLCTAKDDGVTGQGDWLGLQDIMPATDTTDIPGTGVSRTTYENARAKVIDTAIATQAAWNTGDAGRDVMTDLYLNCSYGGEKPTLALMTRTLFKAYNISLQQNERFVGNMSKANGGFPYVTFMVNTKVTWGDNIKSGYFYFINPKHLKLKVLKNKNFKFRDFLPSINQDVEVAISTLGAQLCTGSPRYHGVYTGGGF